MDLEELRKQEKNIILVSTIKLRHQTSRPHYCMKISMEKELHFGVHHEIGAPTSCQLCCMKISCMDNNPWQVAQVLNLVLLMLSLHAFRQGTRWKKVINFKTIWVFCILGKFWIWTWYRLELKITESVRYYLSVCSGIPKVWNDNSNRPCWSPPACINHDEEFHEVFVDRRACWLDQEHITSSHALL